MEDLRSERGSKDGGSFINVKMCDATSRIDAFVDSKSLVRRYVIAHGLRIHTGNSISTQDEYIGHWLIVLGRCYTIITMERTENV